MGRTRRHTRLSHAIRHRDRPPERGVAIRGTPARARRFLSCPQHRSIGLDSAILRSTLARVTWSLVLHLPPPLAASRSTEPLRAGAPWESLLSRRAPSSDRQAVLELDTRLPNGLYARPS